MANKIRIKRRAAGGASGAPSSLDNAELAFNEQDLTLYYGLGTGGVGGSATSVIPIGGNGAFVDLSNNQTIGGTKTFSATIGGSINGNAATVTNGVYTNGSYSDPTWITSIAGSKVSGDISGNAANVTGTVAIANGGSGATTAAAARTAFGATTVGSNLFTLTNPSAVTYVRINADNSISTLDAATFRTAIGAGTGNGSVTSVGLSLPSIFTVTNSPVTGSGTLTGTLASQTQNTVFAAPSAANGAPTFRLLAAVDIPTLTASKISDFDTQVRTSRLDQMAAPTASVSLNSQKITNLATPTSDTDAANKAYVDSVAQGLDAKQSVRVASTANIATLSGLLTVDGITLVAGDRILVKNQSTASQNGIYVASASAWTRATDMDTWLEVPSAFTFVEQGSTQADTGWICLADAGGTINTTAMGWAQFSGAGTYLAGNGLTLTGNTFAVGGTTNRISVTATAVDIASTYVGQTSITTLGTIATGTWNATTIGVNKGGTGATTLTSNGIVYGNGTSAVGVTVAGAWDSTNGVGQILSVNASGVPTWTNTIDGGTF